MWDEARWAPVVAWECGEEGKEEGAKRQSKRRERGRGRCL